MKCSRRHRPPAVRPAAEPLEPRAYFAVGLTFAPVAAYPAGSNPDAIAAADLNGDGHADVVVANYGANNQTVTQGGISVLMGTGTATATGTGAFGAATFYATGVPMQSLAVADLNGDGHPDIVAVGSAANFVYVWLNHGDGTFPANPLAYAVGSRPEGVAVADVNHDGIPDLITANQGVVGKGSLSVLLGTGTGTFAPAVSYDGGPNPDALAVGDLNADGYPDVVTVDPENNALHLLLNRGGAATTGTDQFPATTTDYVTNTTARAVAIVDVNNDARPDLVVANLREANVGALLNNGDGTFQGQVTYRVGGFPFSVASADLNGDNRADLITADSRDNAVGVLVHNGQGGFNTGGGNGAINNHTDQPRQFPTGTAPEAVAVADVNGDGEPDLISADFNDNSIGVLLNRTAFKPLTATTLTVTPSQATVQARNPLTLTAQVMPAPSTAFPAGRVVQFLSGNRVLGIGKLTPTGSATVTTTFTLAAGVASAAEPITVRYGGNAHYAGSVAALTETVVAPSAASPLLAATAVAITSQAGRAGRTATAARPTAAPAAQAAAPSVAPLVAITSVAVSSPNGQPSSPFLPGDAGSVAVTITGEGTGRTTGPVVVSLSIAPFGTPVASLAGAMPLPIVGNARFPLDLTTGTSSVVTVQFAVPATLAAGSYEVVASLAPAGTLTAAQVSPTPVATAAAVPVVAVLVPFVPGDVGSAAVTITNQGPGQASGSVAVSLSIAPAGDPAAAVPLAVVGSATVAVNLRGGTSRAVPVRFKLPTSLAAGDYTVLATLTPARTFTAAQVSPAVAATPMSTTVVAAFGRVPSGQHHPTLTAALPDGSVVTLSLTGPGTGTLTEVPVTAADGTTSYAVALGVVGTSAASTVSITPVAGGPVAFNSITDNYRLGSLLAPGVTLAGIQAIDAAGPANRVASLTLSTGVDRVTLGGVADGGITIGPRGHAALSLGTVTDTAMSAAAALQSLTVNSWSATPADAIVAPGIRGALTSLGDFGARMFLTGAGLKVALGSASIAGTLDSPTWLTGTSIGAIQVGGGLTDAQIVAGVGTGKDGVLGTADDTFNAARIASVVIGGNVTGSLVAAGFRPATTTPPYPIAGGTVLRGGSIGAITVAGTVDAASRFGAASLPTIG